MLHLKSFFNFLERNKLYTAINIFGFAASLTFVVLIGLYVQKELSVDANLKSGERIVMLKHDHYNWPAKIAADIQGRYPQIQATMRHNFESKIVRQKGSDDAVMVDMLMTDSTFFDMFDVQVVEGSASSALVDMGSIVVSENFGRQMFGEVSPLGKQIEYDGHTLTVSAVVVPPVNSIIRPFDCIVRFETITYGWSGYLTTYNSSNFEIFYLLKPGTSLDDQCVDMVSWMKGFFWLFTDGHVKSVSVVPVRDAYWDMGEDSTLRGNDATMVGILVICALAILLFAVINYINLSIAQTSLRAKQAATRRLLGGTKWGLFSSFISESIILCAAAMLLAITFASALISWFTSTLQTSLSLSTLYQPLVLAILVGSVLVLGFVSGVIPAYIITRFKPIAVVSGDFRRRSKMVFSKVLIGVQYLITIVLIACAITITRQTNYMISADLGFDRTQIIAFENNIYDNSVFSLYDELKTIPGVQSVSLAQGSPTTGANNNTFTRDGVNYSFSVFCVDSLFLDILGIEIVSRTGVIDSGAVWVNQTAARKMGIKPTDVQMPWGTNYKPIKGIVADFHTQPMEYPISEVIIAPLDNDWPWHIFVKINSTDLAATKKAVEDKYKELSGGIPCNASFLDADVERWYTKQRQTESLVGMISILAIIISALGILAMSTYFIRQRRGEIAVRKVFGSSNADIFIKLTRQFLIIIGIAFVVSIPIIYYFMNDWLHSFAYHIDITMDIFIIAALVAFAIALVTISWKAYEAMNANPVRSLKAE